jgi:hypothetical protein
MIRRRTCEVVIPLTGRACGKPASVLVGKTPVCAECALSETSFSTNFETILNCEEYTHMAERLGDAPIEDKYRNLMNGIASALDQTFNGKARGNDRKVGFVLLVFEYGEKEGRCNYISNGADRRDVVVLLKEQIKRFEGAPDVTGTA